jgi:hypothetical protein
MPSPFRIEPHGVRQRACARWDGEGFERQRSVGGRDIGDKVGGMASERNGDADDGETATERAFHERDDEDAQADDDDGFRRHSLSRATASNTLRSAASMSGTPGLRKSLAEMRRRDQAMR